MKNWNVWTLEHKSIRLESREPKVQQIICSEPYGRRGCYIYVAMGHNIAVLEEASGTQVQTLRGHPDDVNQMVFNTKENELFSVCQQLVIAWANFPVICLLVSVN